MMAAARRALERVRESPAAWPELGYEHGTDEDGTDHDRNAGRRALVLWALQYDRRPGDLPLLRWLAGQEAVCRGEAPGAGMTDETALAGFLVARHRQVDDVWLHWEIKQANFDTYCGYDQEYLVAAGVQATLGFVRAGQHADRDDVLAYVLDEEGRPWVSEDDLARWAQHRQAYFPADPAAEDPLTWVDRAVLVGERDLARRWLDEWAAGRERDQDTLRTLRYRFEELGAFAEAARAQRDGLAFAEGPWDTASAWQSLAELERRAGGHRAAWLALQECRRALDGVPRWTEVGLGRSYVAELFELAGVAVGELAAVVFAEADRQAGAVPRLPLVVLEAAAAAAGRIGDQGRAGHYRRLGDTERQRIGL